VTNLTGLCPNCNKPGFHYVPPSFGDAGFFICDNLRDEAVVGGPRLQAHALHWQQLRRVYMRGRSSDHLLRRVLGFAAEARPQQTTGSLKPTRKKYSTPGGGSMI
jgi:hypothetical protein